MVSAIGTYGSLIKDSELEMLKSTYSCLKKRKKRAVKEGENMRKAFVKRLLKIERRTFQPRCRLVTKDD